MDQSLKKLLERYMNNDINLEEFKLLKKSLSDISDTDLNEMLSEIWEKYQEPAFDDDNFAELTEKLQIGLKKKSVFTLKHLTRIAAAILIPVFLCFHIYYHIENKRLTDFINRDVSINIKSGEKADIILPDGSKVYLNAASSITYAADFGLADRNVNIIGEAFFEVVKDANKPFLVNTEFIQVEVLGTKFNINSYNDFNFVETTLIEGSIKLKTQKGDSLQTVIMHPNEKVIYDKEKGILSINETNTHFETAWLRGELVFRSAKFPDIIKKLEHRYGVTIQVKGYDSNIDLFTGSFKEDHIHDILKILQLHYKFKYKEVESEIIIEFN